MSVTALTKVEDYWSLAEFYFVDDRLVVVSMVSAMRYSLDKMSSCMSIMSLILRDNNRAALRYEIRRNSSRLDDTWDDVRHHSHHCRRIISLHVDNETEALDLNEMMVKDDTVDDLGFIFPIKYQVHID